MKGYSGISRRGFLKGLCAGTCGSALHGVAGGSFAYALPPIFSQLAPTSCLILVNLSGGCSHNIAPIFHGAYQDRMQGITYDSNTALYLNDEQGLHPALTAFKELYDQGDLALLNMVGFPGYTRSHDLDTDHWHRGLLNSGNVAGGWGARVTSQIASFFAGVSLGGTNLFIRGGTNPPRAFQDLQNFGERSFKWNNDQTEWLRITRENLIALHGMSKSDAYATAEASMINITQSVKIIQEQTSQELPTISRQFPISGFGNACEDAARLIQASTLGTRVIYLEKGGFDTHSDERDRQMELLDDLNGGLAALIETIKALGKWDDVILVTMSEFCRTFRNDSGGTDHGAAAPQFVMGGRVNGRVFNPAPSVAETLAADSFYQNHAIDFRHVFYELVAAMGLNADIVFPDRGAAAPLGLIS